DVIVMLAHTGLRISELVDLRWEDIHFQSQTIRIADERSSRAKTKAGSARTTKGKRSRSLPMHLQVEELLQAMPRHRDGFVLHAARGGRLRSRNVLHDFIEKVIEPLTPQFPTPAGEIGFAEGRLHSFRHYFCSQAFLGGAAEAEIRDWLGHAESKMVEHYRHLRSEDAVRRMRTLSFLDVGEDKGSSAIQE
ncbi:MAG: tyrosine-type recombinase/integrase, partial [Pirellulaceae bacterium]